MRLFKAFNLIHRRSKSATFTPSPHLQPIVHTPNRPASLPNSAVSRNPSLFSIVTSKFNPSSPEHLFWDSRSRRTRSDSSGGLVETAQFLIEEHARLRESLQMWITEHAKAHNLLNTCQAELAAEQERSRALTEQISSDQQVIRSMRRDLQIYKTHFSSDRQSQAGSVSRILVLDSDNTPLVASSDEYVAALRMTIDTRKAVRAQKKITKFWKRAAFANDSLDSGIVTPSASAMSSICEPLSPDRKAAVDLLMSQRSFKIPVAESFQSITALPSSRNSLSGSHFLQGTQECSTSFLAGSGSVTTGSARLGPLASESLKAEITLLFGMQESSSVSSGKLRRRNGSRFLRNSYTSSMESSSLVDQLPHIRNCTFDLDSFSNVERLLSAASASVSIPN